MKCLPLFAAFLLILSCTPVVAQEIECEISIDVQRLTSTDAKDNLSDFVQQLTQYINSYRWTKEDFQGEKIKCTMSISVLGSTGNNHYTAQAFIGSQRPIYKAGRNTAVTRFIDDKWEFDYTRYQSLAHTESRFDPLLSLIDYYAYIILGYDADTYHTNGGTVYFQKAMDIVNKSRGASGAGNGWEASSQGSFSRMQLLDELLGPKFQDFRKAVHVYYYRGLDSLSMDPQRALKKILSALEKIGKLRDKINQPSLLIRTFFETKYMEIAEVFLQDDDRSVYAKLIQIDSGHQQAYEQASAKRR
jgi:hypothetical protein